MSLGGSNVFGARTLRPLAGFERDRLTLAEVIETDAVAGRAMEEIFAAVLRCHESESLVSDQPLDSAVLCCCHERLPVSTNRCRAPQLARYGGNCNTGGVKPPVPEFGDVSPSCRAENRHPFDRGRPGR